MSNNIREKLKEKRIEYIINSTEYYEALSDVCKDIIRGAKSADNEATVVSIFELELFTFIKEILGLKYYPEKEKSVNTERHISKGRIDSKIGALIIEFKQPSSFNTIKKKQKASIQINDYLTGLFEENKFDYLGFVTDGKGCQIVTMDSGIITFGAYEKLDTKHLDLLIRNIVLLDKVALTPENLVKIFCEPVSESLSEKLTICLYKTLKNKATGKSKMLFQEWKELFRLAHDDKSKQKAIQERKQSLEAVVNQKFSKQDDEYLALYALQTTYAIIVKIIAYKVTSKMRFHKSLIDFSTLSNSESQPLRLQMNELEEGAIFRNLGIGNLLEGDFFSWYCVSDQWNEEISNLVKEIFNILTPYEDKAIFEQSNKASDLFKDLFLRIIPSKVRHSLGEFYTPPWLADNLVSEAVSLVSTENWRGIDPCAGSGTFITVMIRKLLEQTEGKTNNERLKLILNRVKGIDLNPLAVLTARINYFINISHLIEDNQKFEIPIYLGDASYVPEKIVIDEIDCLSYNIQTIKGEIKIYLPKSIVKNPAIFSTTMTSIEDDIKNLDEDSISKKLIEIIPTNERIPSIIEKIKSLSAKFIELEQNDWNGIWARIITNFLTTANLGKFDIIVGNPPWIDWKNLPAGYRERIKGLCLSRELFSGDGMTGGINLNVCALVANVSAQNWLSKKGVLAFLMPQSLIFQQTYEGFRKFKLDNKQLYLQQIFDWTSSGHPFKPVQQKFLTYFYSEIKIDYKKGIPSFHYVKSNRENLNQYLNKTEFSQVAHLFKVNEIIIGQASSQSTIFSYANDKVELDSYKKISGSSVYRGREGIEFYPQELFLLEIDQSMKNPPKGKIFVKNFQNKKSKYKIPQQTFILETQFLHPLIKGVNITRFHLKQSTFIVPFPYDKSNKRSPISIKELTKKSKLLSQYFNKFKTTIESQTDYNAKIIGSKHNNEFYALARVGDYSFAKHYVAFRDNTKWVSCVVSNVQTPWGEIKRPQFQNHAVSICQDDSGRFISLDEAHFICAILNAPISMKYVINSSDSRTFKIRPQINIPLFNKKNNIHKRLSVLSKVAHKKYDIKSEMDKIDIELDKLIVQL
ncbi:MAG: SAM-dependent methyltransferase [Desulfobacula sp.]|nr:SAM-dependent methyltransferase [Desulfobacula sp.]